MLCAICLWMFHREAPKGLHHRCFDDLRTAAQGGCKICIVLVMRRNEFGPDSSGERTADPFLTYEWYKVDSDIAESEEVYSIQFNSAISWLMRDPALPSNDIDVYVSETSTGVPEYYLEVIKHATDDLESQPWKVRRECYPLKDIASNTGHGSVFDIARTWTSECEENHDCETWNGPKDPNWIPKRLIDLTDPSALRLLERDSERPSGRYAALSHCWGPDPHFLTLSRNNIDVFRQNIRTTNLPKSFQDAIFICSRLGIHYLWIDSLCIIQDSEDQADWLLHTREMELVYANCYLNLSFLMAACPRDGAFLERNADLLQECCVFSDWPQITTASSDTDDGHEGQDDHKGVYSPVVETQLSKARRLTILARHDYTSSVWQGTALSERGWVLQERLLSPRTLHFGPDRIFWECGEIHSRNEAVPSGISGMQSDGNQFDKHTHQLFNLLHPAEVSQGIYLRLFNRWVGIVRDYTMRKLTFPNKDKLVAFAAIARGFSVIFGDDYFAGHFFLNMPFDLVWRARLPVESGSDERRRPTWSWTSIDTEINRDTLGEKDFDSHLILANVEDVVVDLVDPSNKYGQVRSGHIKMRCFLIQCSLIETEQRWQPELWTIGVIGNGILDDPSREQMLHVSQAKLSVSLDEVLAVPPDIVYLAPLVSDSTDQLEKGKLIQGIILKRQSEGLFTRLGYWEAGSGYYDDEEDVGALLQYLNGLSTDQRIAIRVV
ncbi:hypothetical protein N0V93_009729 [Gnomoniopsis smithogilvyi]|uniref:Heterokaryon incompatibility domain-containing protein n=1 Tax=Gnomoniopsis smithogilvyi TaxID=1191159 RepID=A0A9W9CT32_9PEZI|nr:hypothetical protein N0V93_009729 [Gnomoniopsis smithogilvyi]